MKKVSLILVCIIIFILLFNYNRLYSNDENHLEDGIKMFINRPDKITDTIFIKQALNISNKKYVLFTFNDYIGEAELVRGLNGKYKIETAGSGSNLFQYRVRKINKSKYFVLSGKNYDKIINYIKVILDGDEYKIEIPHQEYFIAYCPVSNNTQSIFPSDFKLFDINNNQITNDVYLKYSH